MRGQAKMAKISSDFMARQSIVTGLTEAGKTGLSYVRDTGGFKSTNTNSANLDPKWAPGSKDYFSGEAPSPKFPRGSSRFEGNAHFAGGNGYKPLWE